MEGKKGKAETKRTTEPGCGHKITLYNIHNTLLYVYIIT